MSKPELLIIFIIAKHQDFTRNLLKMIAYCHLAFATLFTIFTIYFQQLYQGLLSNIYLHRRKP